MISLITATLGRTKEVRYLLESLEKQSYKDFELILVDQNSHHDLEKLVREFPNLTISYIRSNIKGLSFNRNIGLKYAHGDIIGFPDDDCLYDDNLLKEVIERFGDINNNYDLVVVSVKDLVTDCVFIHGNNIVLDRKQLFYKCISYNFFIKRTDEMKFDERLGVGAEFGSGEETDFLWSYLKNDFYGVLINTTYVHHPANVGAVNVERAYSYGLGFGAMMRKEIMCRHNYSMATIYVNGIIRSIGGILLKQRKTSYYNSLSGRIKGFFCFK